MGWKLAIFAFPKSDVTKASVVKSIYGKKAALQSSEETFEAALYPQNDKLPRILEFGQHILLLDWDLIIKAADPLSLNVATYSSYVLQSTVNWYGFTVVREGCLIRQRHGTSDDGVQVHEGLPLDIELQAIKQLAKPDDAASLLQIWQRGVGSAKVENEYGAFEIDQSSMGEDIVFALMETELGYRLDKSSTQSHALLEKTVDHIKKPKRFFIF
ncbi:MAG: hypothetical protein AAGA36_05755 [Pseudomonadota bacterium]